MGGRVSLAFINISRGLLITGPFSARPPSSLNRPANRVQSPRYQAAVLSRIALLQEQSPASLATTALCRPPQLRTVRRRLVSSRFCYPQFRFGTSAPGPRPVPVHRANNARRRRSDVRAYRHQQRRAGSAAAHSRTPRPPLRGRSITSPPAATARIQSLTGVKRHSIAMAQPVVIARRPRGIVLRSSPLLSSQNVGEAIESYKV